MGQSRSRFRNIIDDVLTRAHEVRLLTRDDENDALGILIKAFENDDAFMWTVREDDVSEKEAKARAVYTTRYALEWTLSSALMSGIVLGLFEDDTILVGVIVAYPPDSCPFGSLWSSIYNSITFGSAPIDVHVGDWGIKPKLKDEAWTSFCTAHHDLIMEGHPHWYISLLGVHPSYQGLGYGKRLLSLILQAADATATPTYLETESAVNEKIYHKYGFQTLDKAEIRTSDPTIQPFSSLYFMARYYHNHNNSNDDRQEQIRATATSATASTSISTSTSALAIAAHTAIAKNSRQLLLLLPAAALTVPITL